MRIIDKVGRSHKLTLGKTIYVDAHPVGRLTQSDSSAVMHGFSLPPSMQGLGIGSTLLHDLENLLHKKHVIALRIHIPYEECQIYAHFLKKHGYTQRKNVWSKHI